MIIAVDYDGTICIEQSPSTDREEFPNLTLIEKLKEAKKKGHYLILWTCRGGKWLEEAIQFCEYYDLIFDTINKNIPNYKYYNVSNKVVADLYVDDKSPGLIEYFLNLKI